MKIITNDEFEKIKKSNCGEYIDYIELTDKEPVAVMFNYSMDCEGDIEFDDIEVYQCLNYLNGTVAIAVYDIIEVNDKNGDIIGKAVNAWIEKNGNYEPDIDYIYEQERERRDEEANYRHDKGF